MGDEQEIIDSEEIAIVEYRLAKDQIVSPDGFDFDKVEGHHLDNGLRLGFKLKEQLARADLDIAITTKSKKGSQKESKGVFHIVFIYSVENLSDLAKPGEHGQIVLQPALGNALSSVTYSTARGILLTRLQGTALHRFVLPVIDPNKLLDH